MLNALTIARMVAVQSLSPIAVRKATKKRRSHAAFFALGSAPVKHFTTALEFHHGGTISRRRSE